MKSKTPSEKVTVTCGRCVNGRYYYHGGSGTCFACGGAGTLQMSKAKHDEMLAHAKRFAVVSTG